MWSCLFLTGLLVRLALTKQGFGPTDQDWGQVPVREHAHIFWWLHYTTADVSKYTDRPLIIFLPGGLGASSTGYGNFMEIGPLDVNLEPRNSTWVQWANVMFVDNPAGCGFSYTGEKSELVKNNTEIAQDFLVFLKGFLEKVPQFKGVPLYIFGEFFGAKMAAEIALIIDQARKKGEIEANLTGVALGDSFISPVDSALGIAPYLLNLGQVDQHGYNNIMDVANQMKNALDQNDMEGAATQWFTITSTIDSNTHIVDFYNILTKIQAYNSTMKKKFGPIQNFNMKREYSLDNIMNSKVRTALKIPQMWIDQNNDISSSLIFDFLNPVTKIVEKLLNETDIKVAIYNGQLDLLINTPGTVHWVENINFKDKDLWDAATRTGFAVDGYYEGYVKKYGNFAFYWVDRAGQIVPVDNPSAMYYILKDVTNNFEV